MMFYQILELFMNGFIDDFINVSSDDNSDDYEKKLSKYFAKGFEMPSNLNAGKSREFSLLALFCGTLLK